MSRYAEILTDAGPARDDELPRWVRRQEDTRLGRRDWLALVVLVIAGLNAGLIAAVGLDPLNLLLSHWPWAVRLAQALVGLAALHAVVLLTGWVRER
ncbi:DUF378 domain-containing protein [Bordetella genomosp. 1]|uniref:DUF378 domain-containing protein n=1 Tax=Bordetella genomosp. 1 TaxID=1395607 RepID=A0A261SE48_9BORD|nr:DUF378 domain-containing protein [Bordetella genomosp. 1]MDQ8032884.1 DUF378 domain-containing protein [Bordetella sp.]OZI35257.1 DUF378 domain-containing protein [Bordetella genomosp. 1]OZI63800.1 hypothetical protein CAL27_14430 [Bordetella genomosp. 1]